MRVFYLVWLFILWLNMDNSLQQSDKEIKCELTLPPLQGTRYEPAHRNVFSPGDTLRVICGQNYWISTPNDTSALTTCKEDGEWTVTPECQEVICSHPQDPLVNSWTVCLGQQIRLGETVSYTCKTGYKGTSGIPRATCTREGWKPNPFCQEIKCNRHDIQNAEIVSNIKEKYNFHEYASYVCKKGYQGHFTLTCTESGWTGYSQCTAQCPAIHVDNNVQVNGNLEEAIYGHVVRFSCKSRTEMLSGSPDMYCDENGEWNRPAPKCEAIICAVPNIENGYVPGNIQGYREHEVLHYECNAGYKRAEERPSKCTKLGIRPDPLCQEITCDRLDVPNAKIITNDKQIYKYNERARYDCEEGYRRQFTLTCGERGWNGNTQCTEITCDRREYRNTEIVGSYKYEYRYNDQVQYICKNGHEGSFNMTCKETGWIGSPDCTKRYCKKLHIDHADITRNEKETYSHNERVQYACTHEGGKVFTVTCEQSVWTGVQKCAECPTPEVRHGFAVGPYNGTIYYTCDEGYKLFTKGWWAEAKCNDGEWSGFELCIENEKCGKIPVIPNADVTPPRREDQSYRITCKEGYRAQVEHFSCRQGKWHFGGFSPRTICTPNGNLCSPPPKVPNAVVVTEYQRDFLSDSRVTYTCRNKYTLIDGEDTIRCIDGKWETKDIECTPPTEEQ